MEPARVCGQQKSRPEKKLSLEAWVPDVSSILVDGYDSMLCRLRLRVLSNNKLVEDKNSHAG